MKHIELEEELRRRIRRRRIIKAVISLVFIIIAVAFTAAREQSRVVEEIDLGFITHQSVTYNSDFVWGILIGWLGLVYSVISLITDFVGSKVVTVEVNDDFITLYRGILHINLYVNGEYKDGLCVFGYHLEAPLSDGAKVNVALGKWSAHLTFSNGHKAIDI